MADLSGLGDLVLTVGGDITPLTSALDEIPAAAQQAASQIQAAFDALPSATEEVNASLANLSAGLTEAGSSASETAGHVAEVPPALHDTSEAAGEAGDKLKEFVTAGLELAGIALTFEALKEAVTEIVSAFDQLQRATISLTALTGSAEQATTAIDSLKTLAIGEGLSFPSLVTAQQRMYAFGISATQVPQLLQAAANAAAVMGTDIESASSKLDRIAVSGMAAARQLTQLGLTTHDLAQAMGVADGAVKNAFKNLDQSDRVEVLIAALQKFQGVAAAVADTLSGSWQSFKTSVEVSLEGVGEAIDTSLTSTVKTAQESVIPGIQAMTKAFQDLASVFGPIITGALNSFTQGMGDLLNVVSSGISELVTLGKSANDTGISFSQLVHYVADVTPWGLFADSIHQAAIDLNLLHANADMAAASMLVMDQRFASVTDSLKAFIDKTATGKDSLLAISNTYDQLKQSLADAQATLEKVTEAVAQHRAGLGQLEAAQKDVDAAQKALNGTMDNSRLSIQGVKTANDGLVAALQLAQDNLTTVATAYANGTKGLGQYEAALAAVKSAQDALNGSMRLTPAQDVAQHLQTLNDNLDHAQRYLAAVTEAMKTNTQAGALLAGATKDVATAQAALSVSTQTATTAISSSTPKVIDVTAALNGMAAATQLAATAHANFVGPVQASGSAVQVLGTNLTAAVGGTNQLINGVQVLTGSIPALNTGAQTATTVFTALGGAFKGAAMDANSLVTALNNAAGAVAKTAQETSIATQSFAGMTAGAGQLGAALDKAMSAKLGSISLSLKPGDQYSAYRTGNIEGVNYGGTETAPGFGSALFGPAGVPETMTFDPVAYAQQLQQTNANLNTAATNLTTAAQVQQDAAQTAYDAAKLAGIAAQVGTTAASAINASALRAADAANQQAMNNIGFASVIANTNAVITGTAQALALSSSTLVSAASVVAQIAQKAGVSFASPTMGTVLGSQLNLPNVGSGSGPSGANSGGLPFAPPVFPNSPAIPSVNITGGPQFVQSLMNEFVRNLQTQGIRLTRG